jgi:DNA-binding NtrC family response regulator
MSAADRSGTPRVLIVDDNEAIQQFLAEVFTSWGPFQGQPCEVHSADSMRRALAAAEDREFDLMVLDMVLGDGNGLQVLQELKDRNLDVPVIVLSADDPIDLQKKCIEMGAKAFLRKGDGVETLVREVLNVLDTSPSKAASASQSDLAALDAEADAEPGRILVVDDDPLVCDALASMMHLLGNVEVRSALGGREGLEIAREWSPHVLLLDIAMPDLDGRQTLQKLTEEGARTRVIMVSGFRDSDVAQECVDLGAVDYIPKPVDFPFLRKAVTGHLALAKREASNS